MSRGDAMKKWVILAVVGLAAVVVLGVALTVVPKLRVNAADLTCKNNLREVGLFAAHNADPNFERAKVVPEVPAGTVVNPALSPDQRLSWVVTVLPGFDQRRQKTADVLAGIARDQPWLAEPNQAVARTKIVTLLCPGNPPELDASRPAPTCYVGIAGRGVDAAGLPVADPRAGCFRYDAPTPFAAVTDGLSQTLMVGERSADLGPWLQGGPATVRVLEEGGVPLLGAGGQFGGNHPTGANWGLADGSVRFFTDRTDPRVLLAMATIAGKGTDPLPGE